ncbi:MAG: DNA repair protein RecO, partial [Candidatus Saccharimonadales bacterium]
MNPKLKQFTTTGIVLARTDYGEADRILTFLTAYHGKVKAIAKGVRKSKSKLAGGIELFSVSELTLIVGRGEINTLISTRLVKYYGNIVKDIERTNAGYEIIKLVNKNTEDGAEGSYFHLLEEAFKALDDTELDFKLTKLWFDMQLLKLAGHIPDLQTDAAGVRLAASDTYDFHIDEMRLVPQAAEQGALNTNHIKFMRLGFSASRPQVLGRIQGAEGLTGLVQPLVQSML